LRGIDLLASNIEALNTRAFNSEGTEIFYQEVQYNRYGPILEFGDQLCLQFQRKI
jgi:hypothetical protein